MNTKEYTYAIIENGQIVSGGEACEVCGKPTLTRCLADLFGKSDRTQPLCSDHTPFKFDSNDLGILGSDKTFVR